MPGVPGSTAIGIPTTGVPTSGVPASGLPTTGIKDSPAGFVDSPAFKDSPEFKDSPAGFVDSPAFKDSPAGFEDSPAFKDSPEFKDSPAGFVDSPAFKDSPAYDGAALFSPEHKDTPSYQASPAYDARQPEYLDSPEYKDTPVYIDSPAFDSAAANLREADPSDPAAVLRIGSPWRDLGDSGSAVVGAVVALAGGPVIAGAATSIAAVGSGCDWSINDGAAPYRLPTVLHPTRWAPQGDDALGAVLFNMILMAGIGMAAQVFSLAKRDTDVLGALKMPGLLYAVCSWLYQGSALGSAMIMYRGGAYDVVLGLVLTAAHALGALACSKFVNKYVPQRAIYAVDDRRAGFLLWNGGAGEWINSKCILPTRPCDAAGRCFWMVRSWHERRAWYVGVELMAMLLIALIAATRPGGFVPCGHTRMALCAVFGAQIGLRLWLSPCCKTRDALLTYTSLVLMVGAMLLQGVGYYLERNDGWVFAFGYALVAAALLVLLCNAVLDAVAEVAALRSGDRTRLQKEEATHGGVIDLKGIFEEDLINLDAPSSGDELTDVKVVETSRLANPFTPPPPPARQNSASPPPSIPPLAMSVSGRSDRTASLPPPGLGVRHHSSTFYPPRSRQGSSAFARRPSGSVGSAAAPSRAMSVVTDAEGISAIRGSPPPPFSTSPTPGDGPLPPRSRRGTMTSIQM
eukprot:TRINITY_DN2321_c1_g3_i1.p1 TRINITY_DN2321_c1_g3~~TRINITY_DN2321_c1_g3_i1.p1  ORF type:complete len:694 (+),score=148.02 TRINITY_DN2321_c1_g3_i1:28-2082(+)